jgi:hypothetical protein
MPDARNWNASQSNFDCGFPVAATAVFNHAATFNSSESFERELP